MKLQTTAKLLRTSILLPVVVKSFAPKYLSSISRLDFPANARFDYANIRKGLYGSSSSNDTKIPSIDQLSSDPFMKQIGHASEVVALLESIYEDENKEDDVLETTNIVDEGLLIDLLKAQLSHSDGIRGFFVSYLTGDGVTAADADEVPPPLISAMNSLDSDELISLACMNVIMPTAMITMHKDPDLANSSSKTSKRGIKVLKVLLNKPGVKEQCEAIRNVALGNIEINGGNDVDIKYWKNFFEKWGYEERQKEDIQDVMTQVLST